MNFWATRLGVAQAPQPAQAAPPPPGYAPAPAAPPQTPRPWYLSDFVQAPAQQEVYQQPQQQVPLEEEAHGWGSIKGSLKKARSARLTEQCPECGSGNYFRPEGMPNIMLQCYECGYNPNFSQTGGQGGLPSGDGGPATPARQLATAGAGGVSQFSPQTIVGRL